MNNMNNKKFILLLISLEIRIQEMLKYEQIDFNEIMTGVEEVLDTPLDEFYKTAISDFKSIEEDKSDEHWFNTTQGLLEHIENRYKEQM